VNRRTTARHCDACRPYRRLCSSAPPPRVGRRRSSHAALRVLIRSRCRLRFPLSSSSPSSSSRVAQRRARAVVVRRTGQSSPPRLDSSCLEPRDLTSQPLRPSPSPFELFPGQIGRFRRGHHCCPRRAPPLSVEPLLRPSSASNRSVVSSPATLFYFPASFSLVSAVSGFGTSLRRCSRRAPPLAHAAGQLLRVPARAAASPRAAWGHRSSPAPPRLRFRPTGEWHRAPPPLPRRHRGPPGARPWAAPRTPRGPRPRAPQPLAPTGRAPAA